MDKETKQATQLIGVSSIISLVPLIVTGNPQAFISLLESLQIILFIQYINVPYPQDVQEFLDFFQSFNL